ncbi:uncharacterized protein LOC133745496 [Rosa rugosa]|uniref:uncharacterized protein LOC133745496 n=1 Tax=Rosa rugosa TaxID=74645 RepID=UPI002B413E5E|nr:uncharacterized protein LOC133745496 [Rosa rugosa]XP_062029562.1 uncharacterized protein LOC133745496 [Rosa rugosa]
MERSPQFLIFNWFLGKFRRHFDKHVRRLSLSSWFPAYGDFIDDDKGLTYEGLLRMYDDGGGDVVLMVVGGDLDGQSDGLDWGWVWGKVRELDEGGLTRVEEVGGFAGELDMRNGGGGRMMVVAGGGGEGEEESKGEEGEEDEGGHEDEEEFGGFG